MHDAPRGGNGWRWAALLFGAAFLISGVLLLRDVVQSRRELDANQQLARRVREARDAALTVPVPAAEICPLRQFGGLRRTLAGKP